MEHVCRQMLKSLNGAALVWLLMQSGLGQTVSGKISGLVIGDDGKTLAATVIANRIGAPAASAHSVSGSDGSFSIGGLPAGQYNLCAVSNGGAYLDPCLWDPVLVPVQLLAGQSLAGIRLVLKKGTVLQVRMNDPSSALTAAAQAGKPAPHVIVGVLTSRGLFQSFGIARKDSGGRTHEGTIPFNTNVSLTLTGKDVQVTNAAGASVDLAGATVIVKRAPSDPPVAITFNVSAKKP